MASDRWSNSDPVHTCVPSYRLLGYNMGGGSESRQAGGILQGQRGERRGLPNSRKDGERRRMEGKGEAEVLETFFLTASSSSSILLLLFYFALRVIDDRRMSLGRRRKRRHFGGRGADRMSSHPCLYASICCQEAIKRCVCVAANGFAHTDEALSCIAY